MTKKNKKPKKPMIDDYPELHLSNGVVVYVSRSGLVHASFFDENNDFPSLLESLICMSKHFQDCDISDVENDVLLLWIKLMEYQNKHDCGYMVITENEG